MNSQPLAGKYFFPIALIVCFSMLLVSWGGQKKPHQQKAEQNVTDTIPKHKADKKIRDLDDVIDELDQAELQLNMEKVNAELQKVMKEIDMAKIKMEVENAMKEADVEKIRAEVEKTVKEIDVAKIEREIKESIAKVDWEKMKREVEEVKNIDMTRLDADMKKMELEMKELGPKIEKEIKKAKVEIEKARDEMKEYKSFVDGLDKDGLIRKKESYTIQHKNGELIINGKKQPDDVYSKYRSFLEKHTKFNIKKSGDDFNLDKDDND